MLIVLLFIDVDSVDSDLVAASLELSVLSVDVRVVSVVAEVVGAIAVVVVVVVGVGFVAAVVVDLNGLNGFGLSSVIRISSGLVISFILIPNGLSFANCNNGFFSSLGGVPVPAAAVVVVANDIITSFFDGDFLSVSFAVAILMSSERKCKFSFDRMFVSPPFRSGGVEGES